MATGWNCSDLFIESQGVPTVPSFHTTTEQRTRSSSSPLRSSPLQPLEVTYPEEDTDGGTGERRDIATPTGYNVMKHFERRTILYIIPKEAEDGCPLAVSGTSVRGGGSFTDESKFEVRTEQRGHPSEYIVALRSLKYPDRYLCISRKGKVKARNGYKDSCDFFVRALDSENSAVVCLESARIEGYFLGFRDNSATVVTLREEYRQEHAHFLTRIELKADSRQSTAPPKLRVFGRDSIMNNFMDQRKCVVKLFSHRRYLAVDKRGNMCQTHNQENKYCWFVLYDRGMGIVSLQSYEYPDMWIKLDARKGLSAKALGPDSFFVVKECKNQLVCFEAIRHPGEFIKPPLGDPSIIASPDFDMSIVPLSSRTSTASR